MVRLEEILPEIRRGRSARRKCWPAVTSVDKNFMTLIGGKDPLPAQFYPEDIVADDWELVPSPTRVADYLVEFSDSTHHYWEKETHPIGSQPEGSVLMLGSERVSKICATSKIPLKIDIDNDNV